MLDQYFELLGACASGGAQAVGDAALLLQCDLIALAVFVAGVIVACVALFGTPYEEQSERDMRARLWERISAACAEEARR